MPHRAAAETAAIAAEIALSTQQIVAARLAMGAEAMTNPSLAANAEALRMVTEKAQAFAEAGVAASGGMAAMGARTAAFMLAEATASAASPAAAMSRYVAHWTDMTRLGLQMQSAALEPLRAATAANVKRLGS